MLGKVVKEYGIKWLLNRTLYSLKLKTMMLFPVTERLYEKKAEVVRTDIFSVDVEQLRLFLSGLPENDRKQLVKEADAAADGKIMGFSSVELDYGNPLKWQLNPLTGKETDCNKKWYKIPDFDKERGDIKVTWEASRFTHLITFARAYCMTGSEKYYRAFSDQIADWVDNNKYSYGANYKCGQECSIRMINVLMASALFRNAGLLTGEDEKNVRQIVRDSYRKVRSNFFYAYKCIKNNHTISELMGMTAGAWCCNDLRVLRKANSFINRVVEDQFETDGGYAQYSFNYQRLALMDLNIILSLSEKTGIVLRDDLQQRILNSAMILYQCQTEGYDVPNYGSNDGALIFKMTSCGYRDFRPVINTTFKMITGRELYPGDKHQEELIWLDCTLTGNDAEPVLKKSSRFEKAGIFTLRNEHELMMLVSNDYNKRPGHMDQLHVDLWVDDVNVLCDSGTYSYASELGQKLILNDAHNTVSVKDIPQMSVKPPFLIYNRSKREKYSASENMISAKAVFQSGYSQERRIEKNENGYVITDFIEDVENREAFADFHTVCDVKTEGNRAVLSYNGRVICSLVTDSDLNVTSRERSLYYLKSETINCISVRKLDDKDCIITRIVMEEK